MARVTNILHKIPLKNNSPIGAPIFDELACSIKLAVGALDINPELYTNQAKK